MKRLLLIFSLLVIVVHAEEADSLWSKVDNGLRGRLIILPPTGNESPFYRVYVELQNVQNVLGQKKIKFNSNKMTFKVTSKDGELTSPSESVYDGFKPGWEPILLPTEGTIRFRISYPGAGVPPGTKAMIDLDSPNIWIIPQDGKAYYLSGTLSIPEESTDHPIMVWHGTLSFPSIEIPKVK